MPRKPRSATAVSLSEFDKLTESFTELFSRLRVTLSSNAEAQSIVDRLTSAGFLSPARRPGRPGRPPGKAAPAAAAATGKRKKRGRRGQRIEAEQIVSAIKKGGAAGQTSGQIANTLGVPVDRLRFQLYTMRDSGALKMLGSKSTAKYVVGSAAAAAKPAAAAKAAPATAAKKARKKRKKTSNAVSKKKAATKPAAPSAPAAA